MKKKILTVLISILALCTCMFTLTACGHTHVYDKQVVSETFRATNATCEDKATYYYSCTCGEKGTETFESGETLGHSFTNYIYNNDATYRVDGTETAVCDNGCGESDIRDKEGTALSLFSFYNYDSGYELSKYKGNASDIIIPSLYEGKPVKGIGSYAFYNCKSLTSIEIPNSVTVIGDSAFEGCSSLTSVEIPDSVTSIGDLAFYGCTKLTSILIPDSVTSIGNYAFYYCRSLTSIVIGDSVTSIGSGAFFYCTSLTNVTIGNSVESIGYSAFSNCTSLTSVVIGDSVESIGYFAFSNCGKLTKVYYCGTAEDWAKMNIGTDNTNLTNATCYYYIENQEDVPTDGGNYWHYDENGNPVIW